jgi:Sulfite exporter TauE/SafE
MELHLGHAIFLFLAAVVAGTLNAIAGGGTFLSFPALMSTGVPPVQANATNTVALWPGLAASTGAYLKRLDVPRRLLIPLVATSVVGGFAGSWLLLNTPQQVFLAAAHRNAAVCFRQQHPDLSWQKRRRRELAESFLACNSRDFVHRAADWRLRRLFRCGNRLHHPRHASGDRHARRSCHGRNSDVIGCGHQRRGGTDLHRGSGCALAAVPGHDRGRGDRWLVRSTPCATSQSHHDAPHCYCHWIRHDRVLLCNGSLGTRAFGYIEIQQPERSNTPA